MSYQSDDGRHEGLAVLVFPDGRVSVGFEGGGVITRPLGADGRILYDAPSGVADGHTATGWRGHCECGWHGKSWTRVTTLEEHDFAARGIYDAEDYLKYGDAPRDVDDAIHQEWLGHLEPKSITEVRQRTELALEAQRHVDDAVYAAREDGRSWEEIGKAADMTSQQAHERWSPFSPRSR